MPTTTMSELIPVALGLAGTVALWLVAKRVYRATRHPLTNPVFLSVVTLILLLAGLHIDYQEYRKGGGLLTVMLQPAVVACAVPLFRQRRLIRRALQPVAVGVVLGSITGILSAAGIGLLFGGSGEIARSLAPKSVTTPIAIELSREIGGIPDLTAAIVICTGVLGAMIGPEFLRGLGVKSRFAAGLAVGTAAHGIGIARLEEEDRRFNTDLGTAAGVIGMTLNGVVTAILLPILVRILAFFAARLG